VKLLMMIFVLNLTLVDAVGSPTAFPLFLRQGFSCVLEFESTPTRVVVGDLQSFQVEKMEQSLVVRARTSYATSNMFVYFDKGEPRLFVLTASEDAEPTLYRRFESIKVTEKKVDAPKLITRVTVDNIRLSSARFDIKKDYLTVEVEISAGSKSPIRPTWNLARLKFGDSVIAPTKTWAERKEIQRDSKVKARFIFTKPNVPKNLDATKLILPLNGQATPLSLNLGGK
jgi:hypothetical protein